MGRTVDSMGKQKGYEVEKVKDEFGEYRYTLNPNTTVKGYIQCARCGKMCKGERKTQGYCYCPKCEEQRAKDKEMERRNKQYKVTHRWSQREPQITKTLKSAKEKGMSYGQYVAMKKAGWI